MHLSLVLGSKWTCGWTTVVGNLARFSPTIYRRLILGFHLPLEPTWTGSERFFNHTMLPSLAITHQPLARRAAQLSQRTSSDRCAKNSKSYMITWSIPTLLHRILYLSHIKEASVFSRPWTPSINVTSSRRCCTHCRSSQRSRKKAPRKGPLSTDGLALCQRLTR